MNKQIQPFTVDPTSFRLRRRHSLRWRLLTLLGGMLLVTLLVIGTSVFYFIFKNEQTTWQGRQGEAARYAADIVTTFIQRTTDSLVSASLLDRDILETNPHIMDKLLQQNPALLEMIRLDTNGQVFAAAYQDSPILADEFTIPQSVWFAEGKAGRLYLSSVQISPAGQPYLIISVPAPEGGVVAGRLRMNVLWDVVADLSFGETGQAYVVNQEGQIVAHTNPQVALVKTTLEGRPEMEGLLHAPNHDWNGSYVNFEGTEVVGVTSSVQDTQWVVITEIAETEAFAVSQTALLLLGGGMALFGLLVVLVTSRFLGRLILRPMDQLRSGAVRIGEGDLNYQINLVGQDEVSLVATAFNEMVKHLHERDEALRQQRSFLQQVIDINPHFIFAKDRQGHFTLVNQSFADAYRTTKEALIGKTDFDFNPNAELVERYRRDDMQVIETGQELLIEEEYVTNVVGEQLWRKTIKRPILDENGVVHQVLGVASDITDRKWAEEALALARDQALEASRLKTQLLANVSHDLRTPLGGILGYAEMLQAGVFGTLSDEQVEATSEIIDSTNQLLNFINNLLDQAKIEAGKIRIKAVPFAPTQLIDDAQSMLSLMAQTKGLKLSSFIAPSVPPKLAGDPDWLRQMLVNLVSNAIKFTEQGTVYIQIYLPNETQWAMAVSDTGPGIPPEAQAYIFEAFRQVDGTVTREHTGSGLGLSIVKQLTILMGGQITLISELGKGSTFTAFLPLIPIQQEQEETA